MEFSYLVKLAQTPMELIDVMEHGMLDIHMVCEAYKEIIKRMLEEAHTIQNLPVTKQTQLHLLEGFKSLSVGLYLTVEHIENQADEFLEIYTGTEDHPMGLKDVEQGHKFLISKLSSMLAIPLNKLSNIQLGTTALEHEIATTSFKTISENSSIVSYLIKEKTNSRTLKEDLDAISNIPTEPGSTSFGNKYFQFLLHVTNSLSKI